MSGVDRHGRRRARGGGPLLLVVGSAIVLCVAVAGCFGCGRRGGRGAVHVQRTPPPSADWRSCLGACGADGRVFYQVAAATYVCDGSTGRAPTEAVVRVWYPADRPELGCLVRPPAPQSDVAGTHRQAAASSGAFWVTFFLILLALMLVTEGPTSP